MKTVIIIGAGVAGLSAGIYAQKNGYQAVIYEMHSIVGGECTGWDRGGYHFDGCIHWLLGSKPGSALNRIWHAVGALDSVKIINREECGRFEKDGRTLILYRDLDRLQKHLIELSSDDEGEIRKLCKVIRGCRRLKMPTGKPFDLMNAVDGLKMIAEMVPVSRYLKYSKVSVEDLASRFIDPLIRMALTEFIPQGYSAMALLSTLAAMSDDDAGWPEGGSRRLAQRMERRFLDLGGRIELGSRVAGILVEDDAARGIRLADGREIQGDAVICTTDGYEALFGLLEGKYLSDQHRAMYSVTETAPVYSSFQVWAGIAADLSSRPHSVQVELPQPVELGGHSYPRLWLMNYSFDPVLAPPGHSVVTSFFPVSDFEWWQRLYEDRDAYLAEKNRIAEYVKHAIEETLPETAGQVKTMDVATPMTYVRYCNAWRGAWMSWVTTPTLKTRFLPMRLKGLRGFVMAGQWIVPPGGLPTAVVTGRWAVQHLCAADKRPFVAE